MKLYREVRIETADDLDQLEEYYVKETSPGGAWQIVLVPIEAEEEWTPMVDGHAYVNGKKSEAHVRATVAEWPGAVTGRRLVTPWEEA